MAALAPVVPLPASAILNARDLHSLALRIGTCITVKARRYQELRFNYIDHKLPGQIRAASIRYTRDPKYAFDALDLVIKRCPNIKYIKIYYWPDGPQIISVHSPGL